MLVKSRATKHHITDLKETFAMLRHFRMKLNPNKCAFRVTSSKFLGFMVLQQEIETNPKKIRALQEMTPPRMIREVNPDRKNHDFGQVPIKIGQEELTLLQSTQTQEHLVDNQIPGHV